MKLPWFILFLLFLLKPSEVFSQALITHAAGSLNRSFFHPGESMIKQGELHTSGVTGYNIGLYVSKPFRVFSFNTGLLIGKKGYQVRVKTFSGEPETGMRKHKFNYFSFQVPFNVTIPFFSSGKNVVSFLGGADFERTYPAVIAATEDRPAVSTFFLDTGHFHFPMIMNGAPGINVSLTAGILLTKERPVKKVSWSLVYRYGLMPTNEEVFRGRVLYNNTDQQFLAYLKPRLSQIQISFWYRLSRLPGE